MIASQLFWIFFFSSRRRHTRCSRDWSSDVCSSDLEEGVQIFEQAVEVAAAPLRLLPRGGEPLGRDAGAFAQELAQLRAQFALRLFAQRGRRFRAHDRDLRVDQRGEGRAEVDVAGTE